MFNTKLSRRTALGIGVSSLGLALLPRQLRAAPTNDQVFVLVFLRGGADGMSIVQPAPGASEARRRYELWRSPETRVDGTVPLGQGLALHPAMSSLELLLNRREMCVVPGVAGARLNRSHFEQQDLIDSGAPETGATLSDGFLGRALDQLPQKDSPLAALALSQVAPYSLRHASRSAVTIPDFASFGEMWSGANVAAPDFQLRDRLQKLYVDGFTNCAPGNYCSVGAAASGALTEFTALRGTLELAPSSLEALPQLIAADTAGRLKLVTVDYSGWDTHFQQGNAAVDSSGHYAGTLSQRLAALSAALRAFYDRARAAGVWGRITVAVVTEFGRTTRQNGTAGTDHGFGGTALILGSGLRNSILPVGYFPPQVSASFYAQAETTNVLPRLVEHRQIFAEILQRRLEVSDLGAVFPGFSPSLSLPSIFS